MGLHVRTGGYDKAVRLLSGKDCGPGWKPILKGGWKPILKGGWLADEWRYSIKWVQMKFGGWWLSSRS